MGHGPSDAELARAFALMGNRFVEQGWATGFAVLNGEVKIEWTAAGKMKMSTLHALLTELGYRDMDLEHKRSLFAWLNVHGLRGR